MQEKLENRVKLCLSNIFIYFRVNLRQYLTEFVGEFTKQPYFMSHFGQHLNAMEKKALASIGIQA